ncbi:hypothetical protein BC831DRAFT_449014 [Entophlyctis helioformis]|nr:hypothetical protein BC831DRAFT_449014 [Entophlyctis helioformis]
MAYYNNRTMPQCRDCGQDLTYDHRCGVGWDDSPRSSVAIPPGAGAGAGAKGRQPSYRMSVKYQDDPYVASKPMNSNINSPTTPGGAASRYNDYTYDDYDDDYAAAPAKPAASGNPQRTRGGYYDDDDEDDQDGGRYGYRKPAAAGAGQSTAMSSSFQNRSFGAGGKGRVPDSSDSESDRDDYARNGGAAPLSAGARDRSNGFADRFATGTSAPLTPVGSFRDRDRDMPPSPRTQQRPTNGGMDRLAGGMDSLSMGGDGVDLPRHGSKSSAADRDLGRNGSVNNGVQRQDSRGGMSRQETARSDRSGNNSSRPGPNADLPRNDSSRSDRSGPGGPQGRNNLATLPDTAAAAVDAHICGDCKKPIRDIRDAFEIEVLGAWYHADCFKCVACRTGFSDDVPFVPHKGEAFCEYDYERLFLPSCAACKKPITDGRISYAYGKPFHERHLRCRVCKNQIPNGRHFEHQNRIYCEADYTNLLATLPPPPGAQPGAAYVPQPLLECAGCLRRIDTESCIHALGATYHRECFGCTSCRQPFPNKKFFVWENKPYCMYHYHEQNNSLCGTCGDPIEGPCVDVADIGRKFHPPCWCCASCSEPLTGIYYSYNGKPYCENDIDRVFRGTGGKGNAPMKRRTIFSTMGTMGGR